MEEQEILNVIAALPLNKSPGIDSLSSEYYKALTPILSPHLVHLYNKAVSIGKFPKEMLEAIIETLPKPGKEPNQPQNFRLISLLNSDFKIYSKILANRLLELTPLLLGPEQVSFVKGRQAPDGTRKMIDLIYHAEACWVPSLLLALDKEKVFDRVHWEYLSQVLTKLDYLGQYTQLS